MVAKLGSEAALQQAMVDGEVKMVMDKGKKYYIFETITLTKETGAEGSVQSSTGRHANDAQMAALAGYVDAFNPQFSSLMLQIISQ